MNEEKGFKQSGPPPPFNNGGFSQLAPSTSFASQFACITLNLRDIMRFINFGPDDVGAIVAAVPSVWSRGIQEQGPYEGAWELKFKGHPWGIDGHGDDEARMLVQRTLEVLYNRGWVLQTVLDISKKAYDKDTMLFRHQSPSPPPADWLTISFDSNDKLKIVGAPPQDLAEAIRAAFGQAVKNFELQPTRLKIKFHGRPWLPTGSDTVTLRIMLIRLVETLEAFGYSVYGSIDQQNATKGRDADVLVVHRQKSWTPGLPVWHR